MQSHNPFADLGRQLQQRIQSRIVDHQEYITQSVDDVFEEVPVDLNTFLYSDKFLGFPRLSDKQYRFIEAGSQIYYPTTLYHLGWRQLPYYNMLVAKWGKGSGKDTVSRLVLLRIAYQLICLRNPQKYLESTPGESINMLNVAYSAKQASVIFFQPLKRLLGKVPALRGKFDPKEDVVEFVKDINIHSGHSEQESQEGHNLIAAVLDEIAAFKTSAELQQRQRRTVRALEHSAEALDNMLISSAVSRFPQLHKIMYLSYTRFQGDYIEQKYNEGLARPKTAFVSSGATWEVNPTKTREMFQGEYDRNPENAAAKYECKPPKAVDRFFKHLTPELIAKVFPRLESEQNPLSDNPFRYEVKPWFKGILGTSYFAHVDLGLSGDRAGLAICHRAGHKILELERTRESGEKYVEAVRLKRIKLDLWGGIQAPHGGEIDLETIREFLLMLHASRDLHIAKVTYDRFQSAESIQGFRKRGIEADLLSVDRDTRCYDVLKDLMYSERLEGYYDRVGVDELESLNIITGNKVDHPLTGSKDMSDALAGAVFNAIESPMTDSSPDDIFLGPSYNEIFAAYQMDKQPGLWGSQSFPGRARY